MRMVDPQIGIYMAINTKFVRTVDPMMDNHNMEG